MSDNYTKRLPGMDGLRALAATAVFGVHLNQVLDVDLYWGPFDLGLLLENGDVGVALFFVLSGYLLSRPFLAYRTGIASRPSLPSYALHRLVRIVPAYYLCLLVLLWLNGTWQVPEGRIDALLHLLFIFNFAEFSTLSINPVFWTLAVEMQFYLLLPFLLLLPRRLLVAVLVVAVMGYALHVSLNQWLDRPIPWFGHQWMLWLRPHGAMLNHSLFAHLPHFIIGVLAAMWQMRGGLQALSPRLADGLLVSILLALPLLLSSDAAEWLQVPYGRYFLPGIPLLLALLVVVLPLSSLGVGLFDSRPLRYVGKVSYGVYLFHLPILWWLDRYMQMSGWDALDYPWLFAASAFGLSLVAAALSFHLLEQPLMRRVRRAGDN